MSLRIPLALVVCSLVGAVPALCVDDVTAANPLTAPLFSIAPTSPEISIGLFNAADLLRITPAEPNLPTVIVTASSLSLMSPVDDIDAISFLNALDPTVHFVLVFSVDEATIGAEPPDPNFAALGFPFNVQDQAAANQASGDAFICSRLFDSNGPLPDPPGSDLRGPRAGASNNAILAINQGDAGGVDFRIVPRTLSPSQTWPGAVPKTNLNAGAGTTPPSTLRGGDPPPPPQFVLYTLSRESPSLGQFPYVRESGADIYIDTALDGPGGEELVVVAEQIGLVGEDDIDALLIIDDGDGMLQLPLGQDRIIFSLAPGSPTLGLAGLGPADLLVSNGGGVFGVYAPADTLGLFSADNVNMLDFVPCDDLEQCITEWAIGYIGCPGDLDGDRDVDFDDLNILLAAYNKCDGDAGYLPVADLDHDGCVDFDDLNLLLAHYGTGC